MEYLSKYGLLPINRQQPSPLLYSIDIWPARNSRLTPRELKIARCASVLAWSYLAGRSPEQLVLELFAQHQRFTVCFPYRRTSNWNFYFSKIHKVFCKQQISASKASKCGKMTREVSFLKDISILFDFQCEYFFIPFRIYQNIWNEVQRVFSMFSELA